MFLGLDLNWNGGSQCRPPKANYRPLFRFVKNYFAILSALIELSEANNLQACGRRRTVSVWMACRRRTRRRKQSRRLWI